MAQSFQFIFIGASEMYIGNLPIHAIKWQNSLFNVLVHGILYVYYTYYTEVKAFLLRRTTPLQSIRCIRKTKQVARAGETALVI